MRKGEKRPDLQRARLGECEVCGKTFRAVSDYTGANGYTRKQKYCSKECWSNRGEYNDFICEYCGKPFRLRVSLKQAGRYCSRECSQKGMVGENAPRFKDGESLKRDRARNSNKLRIWREAVFKRDNYTCQNCGSKEYLNAHHIKEWAVNKELRFSVDNGVSLCEKCHGEIHGRDFSNRRNKKCIKCGVAISGVGKSGMCRSCSIREWHKSRGQTAVLNG